MKIHNIRFGLATNSSSTHSLIFVPNASDKDIENDLSNRGIGFGWEYFTAASDRAKMEYLGILLRKSLHDIPQSMVDTIIKEWVGHAVNPDSYIDHQSVFTIPRDWKGTGPDKEFFDELKQFMLQDDLIILGGNDNDEDIHHLDDGGSFTLKIHGSSVARKDPKYNYWTLFNRRDGSKVRMSFDQNAEEPTKAFAPELVDIKITDFCTYDCEYCYQGSTPEGKHGNIDYSLVSALAELKVFEVAIGGGEPTLHPKFGQILDDFRNRGIVPNFTTRSLSWLKDTKTREDYLSNAGAFALSVESPEQIKELSALLRIHNVSKRRASVHYVMGSNYDFQRVVQAALEEGIRITLLGYKTTGRGSDFKPVNYSNWIKEIQELNSKHGWVKVGIDTVLAAKYEEQLKESGINSVFYTTREGAFSCYIDAVNRTIGPSSFCPKELMRPLTEKSNYKGQLAREIRLKFQAF